ncbi:MAG TPA: hypothetical protein VJL10_08970 [Anaerolineales bacterium]|nr:hypothetical protein [Anaerolineales bacterium]
MSIFRHIVGITCELLTLDDPYDKRERVTPAVTDTRKAKTGKGAANITGKRPNSKAYTVLEVTANNYAEAAKFSEGVTIEGNASIAIVHTGRNKWEIRVEEWDTDFTK